MSELKVLKQEAVQNDQSTEDNISPSVGAMRSNGGTPFATEQFVMDAISDLEKRLEKKLEEKVNRPKRNPE